MAQIVESERKKSDNFTEAMHGNTDIYEDWAETYEQDLEQEGFCAPQGLAKALAKVFNADDFQFRDNKNISILDIGSGTGQTAKSILEVVPGPERLIFTGVDISIAMNEQARAKQIYSELLLKDLNHDEVSGQFDVIVSTGTFALGHVKLDKIFDILEKNLSPGGQFMLTSNCNYYDPEIAVRLENLGCEVRKDTFQHFENGATAALLCIKKVKHD